PHRQPRVARISLLHCVDGQESDGVDADIVRLLFFHDRFLTRRGVGPASGNSLFQGYTALGPVTVSMCYPQTHKEGEHEAWCTSARCLGGVDGERDDRGEPCARGRAPHGTERWTSQCAGQSAHAAAIVTVHADLRTASVQPAAGRAATIRALYV